MEVMGEIQVVFLKGEMSSGLQVWMKGGFIISLI